MMQLCTKHLLEDCTVCKTQAAEQMSFGDFETIMSIIEKATEKDIRDIIEMLDRRKQVMRMLREKKEATGNA